jgi:hypothetical protein
VALKGEESIEVGGRTFTPDATKAYMSFETAHTLPCLAHDDCAVHPNVVAKSWAGLERTWLNVAHIMMVYGRGENPKDWIIGSVVAAEYPQTPKAGWKVPQTKDGAPFITGAAVIWKNSVGAVQIMEKHLFEKPWMVSMEMGYDFDESGFLVPAGSGFENETPDDIAALGYDYAPTGKAPPELAGLWDRKADGWATEGRGQRRKWKGILPKFLQGGLEGDRTIFCGMAICENGKDPDARIQMMLASSAKATEAGAADRGPDWMGPLERLAAAGREMSKGAKGAG